MESDSTGAVNVFQYDCKQHWTEKGGLHFAQKKARLGTFESRMQTSHSRAYCSKSIRSADGAIQWIKYQALSTHGILMTKKSMTVESKKNQFLLNWNPSK